MEVAGGMWKHEHVRRVVGERMERIAYVCLCGWSD